MRYYKMIIDGYLIAVGSGSGGEEITEAEYNNLLAVIRNKPTAPEGYDYRLKDTLEWELYELPIIPPAEEAEELTYDELLEALAEAEVELCLWELGIHDDFETEEI